MTSLEKKIVALYTALVLAFYLLGFIVLKMYTTCNSREVALVVATTVFPGSEYIAIRLTAATGSKLTGTNLT